MPRPKDFTPAMERRRKRLAKRLARHKEIKSPWGLATWLVRREKRGWRKWRDGTNGR